MIPGVGDERDIYSVPNLTKAELDLTIESLEFNAALLRLRAQAWYVSQQGRFALAGQAALAKETAQKLTIECRKIEPPL